MLRYQQWQLGWQLHWQAWPNTQLTLGWVQASHQALDYAVLDGRDISQTPADNTSWQFALQLQF